jgi:hypothetical protein
MPICIITEDEDPRLEQRQLQATYEFRLDVGNSPELPDTTVVQPLPLVWPTARADVHTLGKIVASHSEYDTGTQHDQVIMLQALTPTKVRQKHATLPMLAMKMFPPRTSPRHPAHSIVS